MSDLRCPSHPEANLIEDPRAGDLICPTCGLVVGDRLCDVGTEWRSFNNEKSCKDPSRVGAPENSLLSGSDLSTTIAIMPGGSGDTELANAQRKQMNNGDRQLIQAFGIIREMAERINMVKSIQDTANRIYKEALDTGQVKGKNIEAVSAACLYIACRKEQVPRRKEICAISRVSKKDIGRCFKLIIKALETNLQHITSDQFMARFCANLGLPMSVQKAATFIAKQAVKLDLVAGRSPISIAAAAIYMASQASATQKSGKDIGEIAGVAEMTIKQSYKLMLPKAEQLFPPDLSLHDKHADKLEEVKWVVVCFNNYLADPNRPCAVDLSTQSNVQTTNVPNTNI